LSSWVKSPTLTEHNFLLIVKDGEAWKLKDVCDTAAADGYCYADQLGQYERAVEQGPKDC
jgi:hypothetical protein